MQIDLLQGKKKEHRVILTVTSEEAKQWGDVLAELRSNPTQEQCITEEGENRWVFYLKARKGVGSSTGPQNVPQNMPQKISQNFTQNCPRSDQNAFGGNDQEEGFVWGDSSRFLLAHPEKTEWVVSLHFHLFALNAMCDWLESNESTELDLDLKLGRSGLSFPSNVELVIKK